MRRITQFLCVVSLAIGGVGVAIADLSTETDNANVLFADADGAGTRQVLCSDDPIVRFKDGTVDCSDGLDQKVTSLVVGTHYTLTLYQQRGGEGLETLELTAGKYKNLDGYKYGFPSSDWNDKTRSVKVTHSARGSQCFIAQCAIEHPKQAEKRFDSWKDAKDWLDKEHGHPNASLKDRDGKQGIEHKP